jgi:hypothetical protein
VNKTKRAKKAQVLPNPQGLILRWSDLNMAWIFVQGSETVSVGPAKRRIFNTLNEAKAYILPLGLRLQLTSASLCYNIVAK